KWFESDFQKRTYLIISSIGAGLGFGTKYNGMIIAFFLVLFTGLVISREKKDDKLAFKSMIIFGFTILLCITPWIFRNIIDSRNPFFPLFLNVFHSTINMPAELIENVNGETINRIINGGDSIFSLFLLPLRVFFEGADHDFLKFDGVLNPFLILILPFIFYPKFTDLNKKKIVFYLFFMFTIVYLVTLYSNNIRVRYFIPILPILIILNIEALKNIYNSKNFYPLFYLFSACFIIYNINYGIFLSNNLNLLELNPFSIRSKEIYLKNHLVNYDFIEYINNNTPESSVIYEALTGGRSYYINRSFYCDTASIDRYLLELAEKGAESDEYKKHFENLPNSNLSATHLLIRANGLAQTFININRNEKDPESTENVNKLQGYFQFLNELKLLKKEDGVYLFEL
ncbi:MAG: hypothetical protein KKD38_10670, partial [Candidatus Delongbacteria bacterium]|nr:hypothetical protein [Candidatus Delongbacteria bacterium]MCG2760329.1 hypothetical protein [Candidatus Delongbacteria bacterium]